MLEGTLVSDTKGAGHPSRNGLAVAAGALISVMTRPDVPLTPLGFSGFVSSVCEIAGQSNGGLSVLRTFRLLRVLKLVRFMPALRRQLVVLMKTMDNVATFCMLLMLFIFIFR